MGVVIEQLRQRGQGSACSTVPRTAARRNPRSCRMSDLRPSAGRRPVKDDQHGAARPAASPTWPSIGDVLMVEPVAASPAAKGPPAVRSAALLRQIPLVQGALVSLEPATGRVLAVSGGWSYEMSQFNRATQAQPAARVRASSRMST